VADALQGTNERIDRLAETLRQLTEAQGIGPEPTSTSQDRPTSPARLPSIPALSISRWLCTIKFGSL
jgi:hypothetical protein